MSNLSDLLRQFELLESRLDERIYHLEQKNERLRRNKRILTQCANEEAAQQQQQQQDNTQAQSIASRDPIQADQPTSSSSSSQQANKNKNNGVDNDKIDTADSLPNKLDEILSLAKNIRGIDDNVVASTAGAHGKGSGSKSVTFKADSGAKKGTKGAPRAKTVTLKPVTLSSALKQAESAQSASSTAITEVFSNQKSSQGEFLSTDQSTQIPPNGEIVQQETSRPTYKQQVVQQLQLLNRQRLLSRFKCSFSFSSNLFQSQANVLFNSTISNMLPIPSSILLDSLALLQYGITRNHIRLNISNVSQGEAGEEVLNRFIETLGQEMSTIVAVIMKSPTSKIANLPSSHFNSDQCGEFVDLWYRSRIILEMYAALVSFLSSDTSAKSDQKSGTLTSILEGIACPLTFDSPTNDEVVVDRSDNLQTIWFRKQIQHVRNRNKLLSERVSFWLEKYVAKNLVPSLIQQLKACVKASTANSANTSPRTPTKSTLELRDRWIKVLKCYQILYTILIANGRDHAACVFVNR